VNPQKKNEDGFFSQVYEVTKLVPAGRVTTYGAIARFLGSAGSARMVCWALNNSHSQSDFIPAHRVVNRIGMLTGKHHFPGRNIMEELLKSEGIRVEDDMVIDFENIFWDPGLNLLVKP
jgi:methylated-DNA-protein-cysteine methyltransferase related protein